jgi:hypothetical protein
MRAKRRASRTSGVKVRHSARSATQVALQRPPGARGKVWDELGRGRAGPAFTRNLCVGSPVVPVSLHPGRPRAATFRCRPGRRRRSPFPSHHDPMSPLQVSSRAQSRDLVHRPPWCEVPSTFPCHPDARGISCTGGKREGALRAQGVRRWGGRVLSTALEMTPEGRGGKGTGWVRGERDDEILRLRAQDDT